MLSRTDYRLVFGTAYCAAWLVAFAISGVAKFSLYLCGAPAWALFGFVLIVGFATRPPMMPDLSDRKRCCVLKAVDRVSAYDRHTATTRLVACAVLSGGFVGGIAAVFLVDVLPASRDGWLAFVVLATLVQPALVSLFYRPGLYSEHAGEVDRDTAFTMSALNYIVGVLVLRCL